MDRRLVLGALALSLATGAVKAQESWPQRPIRLVIPGPSGGTTDVLARLIQEPLSKALGQPVIVEYRAGGGGAIASQYIIGKPADGYEFLIQNSGMVTLPLVQKKPSHDAIKDFTAVTLLGTVPLVLMASTAVPGNLADFVKHARSNPGTLEWGTSAIGGVGHLSTLHFHDMAGIKNMVMVSYAGVNPVIQALLGGQIKYAMSTPSETLNALVKDGRLRVLAVASAQRSPLVPDVPSMSEVVPGFHADTWFGIVAKAGTPAPVVKRMSDEIGKIVATPEISERIQRMYIQPKTGFKELADMIRSENQQWSAVVKSKAISID